MKSTLRALVLVIGSALTAFAQGAGSIPAYEAKEHLQGMVRIKGSDSIDPLMRLWVQEFEMVQPEVHFTLDDHGSATAPPALMEGESEIGPMSRAMNEAEQTAFKAKFGYEPTALTVCTSSKS